MNGTSIVGFGNFSGLSRRKHNVVSATFVREFFSERPNGLRAEFTVMRGSLLPVSNFNQREVNDAEKSIGFGFRVVGSDKRQRLRYEAGFTRSRFTNPSDPLLEQGFNVTAIRPATRNARYAEISFDFLENLKLWLDKKLKVTGTYRHEEIQPLFRSTAASTQADRRQNQFEVAATFGEINFAYGNLRDHDNLNELPSILQTISRRNNTFFGIPLNRFFTPAKPTKWLPQISYTADRVHQYGAFFPVNGEFRDPSQIPDQVVQPGEEPPREEDLLTEATLPVEQRGTQRRYTQVGRFNYFLPPVGKFILPLEEPDRVPTVAEGQYILLLRIEAVDDKESDSDLAAIGVGNEVVHSGAVAAFPIPTLKFFVIAGSARSVVRLSQLSPADNAIFAAAQATDFAWVIIETASLYRLEISEADGKAVLSALLPRGITTYRAPSWLRDRTNTGGLRWRVVALNEMGQPLAESDWRNLRFCEAGTASKSSP